MPATIDSICAVFDTGAVNPVARHASTNSSSAIAMNRFCRIASVVPTAGGSATDESRYAYSRTPWRIADRSSPRRRAASRPANDRPRRISPR
jgi:hypothetical protein